MNQLLHFAFCAIRKLKAELHVWNDFANSTEMVVNQKVGGTQILTHRSVGDLTFFPYILRMMFLLFVACERKLLICLKWKHFCFKGGTFFQLHNLSSIFGDGKWIAREEGKHTNILCEEKAISKLQVSFKVNFRSHVDLIQVMQDIFSWKNARAWLFWYISSLDAFCRRKVLHIKCFIIRKSFFHQSLFSYLCKNNIENFIFTYLYVIFSFSSFADLTAISD